MLIHDFGDVGSIEPSRLVQDVLPSIGRKIFVGNFLSAVLDNSFYAALILGSALGQLQRAILQATYEHGDPEEVEHLAVRLAALTVHCWERSKYGPEENPFTPILAELEAAESKHPGWPSDPFHGVAIIGEELGEWQAELLQESPDRDAAKNEFKQMAAMAVRFVTHLQLYDFEPSFQVMAPHGHDFDHPIS